MAKVIITGIIKEITPVKSGVSQSGKEWSKCEIVVTEQDGQYPNDVAVIAFNNTIDMLMRFATGSYVQVTAWATSQAKDKNGEIWYQTQLRLNNIVPMAVAQQYPQQAVAASPHTQYRQPLPQTQNYSQQAPPPPPQQPNGAYPSPSYFGDDNNWR